MRSIRPEKLQVHGGVVFATKLPKPRPPAVPICKINLYILNASPYSKPRESTMFKVKHDVCILHPLFSIPYHSLLSSAGARFEANSDLLPRAPENPSSNYSAQFAEFVPWSSVRNQPC